MWEEDVQGQENFPVSAGLNLQPWGCESKSITTQPHHTHARTRACTHMRTHTLHVLLTKHYLVVGVFLALQLNTAPLWVWSDVLLSRSVLLLSLRDLKCRKN